MLLFFDFAVSTILNYSFAQEGKNDLQTEADRAVQKCIVSSLHKQFPSLTIIGEEVSVKIVHMDGQHQTVSEVCLEIS